MVAHIAFVYLVSATFGDKVTVKLELLWIHFISFPDEQLNLFEQSAKTNLHRIATASNAV